MIITVTSNGRPSVVNTDQYGNPATIGALFGNSSFRNDHAISERAIPTVNGTPVDGGSSIVESSNVSFTVAASSKS